MQEVSHSQNIYETQNKTVQITPKLYEYHVLRLPLTDLKRLGQGSVES